MTGHFAKHRRTRIMYVTPQELTTERNFLFCRCNPAHRKSRPGFETRSGKRHGLIKIGKSVLVQRLSAEGLYDYSHENKIIIAVHVFSDRPQFAREYAPVHGIF